MTLIELFILAVGLSMDAMAVSICKGLSVSKAEKKQMCIVGLYFGGFQALMPLLGYWLGINFQTVVESVDHWIAFVLLGLIGLNMIKESREGEVDELDAQFGPASMLPLSMPGIASGITMVFVPAVSTFIISRMLGGGTNMLIGDLIDLQFLGNAYNPNLGAAMSLVLMVFILLCMSITNSIDNEEMEVSML